MNKLGLNTSEFKACKLTRIVFYVFSLSYLFNFFALKSHRYIASMQESYTPRVCPPYFQECFKLFSIGDLPVSNGYNYFISFVLILQISSVVLFYFRKYLFASIIILSVIFFHFIQSFLFVANISMPFEYFSTIVFLIFIVSNNKLASVRFSVIVFYIIAGLTKLTPAWILGSYFGLNQKGLPLFDDRLILLLSNIVIIFELVGIHFLNAKVKVLRLVVFIFFICFHLYSYLIVGLRYPAYCIPLIIILYTIAKEKRLNMKPSSFSIVLSGILVLLNVYPLLIPGDHRVTYEGSKPTLNMFDGNRQSRLIVTYPDGKIQKLERRSSYTRTTAYLEWKKYHLQCPSYESIGMKLDLSIDGQPFYNIINQDDICQLTFEPYQRNEWIKIDTSYQNIVGYPNKGGYFSSKFKKKQVLIERNPVDNFSHLWGRAYFEKNYTLIRTIYYFISAVSFCVIFISVFRRDYRN